MPVVGGTGQWPYGVQVNGNFAVIEHNGRPYVTLPQAHEITGYLDWMTQPSSLQVPRGLAQITCRDSGQEQNTQYSTTEGMLRIGEDLMESSGPALECFVALKMVIQPLQKPLFG